MNVSPGIPALELAGVTKDYAIGVRGFKLRALDNLSLKVGAGEALGLAGPNGSGKSTTLKLMLGLVSPTAGECRIFGRPSVLPASRSQVGYVCESPQFARYLTGREVLHFAGRLCGLTGPVLDRQTRAVLEWVGLDDAADRLADTYSKGMLQRLGLAQALVHDPAILVLDEPTAGVDPVGAARICRLLHRLKAAGKTLVVTSHQLTQLEDLCDRVAILDRGRLVLSSTMEAVVGTSGRQFLQVDALSPAEFGGLSTWLARRGRSVQRVSDHRSRLEEAYLESVEGER
jgi:ABC-2 type transport system ATP-binding protein